MELITILMYFDEQKMLQVFNSYLALNQSKGSNLWSLLTHLKNLESLAQEKMVRSKIGERPNYLSFLFHCCLTWF